MPRDSATVQAADCTEPWADSVSSCERRSSVGPRRLTLGRIRLLAALSPPCGWPGCSTGSISAWGVRRQRTWRDRRASACRPRSCSAFGSVSDLCAALRTFGPLDRRFVADSCGSSGGGADLGGRRTRLLGLGARPSGKVLEFTGHAQGRPSVDPVRPVRAGAAPDLQRHRAGHGRHGACSQASGER